MTMHLEGPWLSTTGKKKGKKTWSSADQKRKAELLAQQWKEKQKEWSSLSPNFSKKNHTVKTIKNIPKSLTPRIPPGRETPKVQSLDTGWIPCLKGADKEYTGTKVKGIGTMHKSNAVPIFSDEEAVSISKMRR